MTIKYSRSVICHHQTLAEFVLLKYSNRRFRKVPIIFSRLETALSRSSDLWGTKICKETSNLPTASRPKTSALSIFFLTLPILDTLQKIKFFAGERRYSNLRYQKTKGLKYPCKIDLVIISMKLSTLIVRRKFFGGLKIWTLSRMIRKKTLGFCHRGGSRNGLRLR